jgi:hypothetical protein
MRESFPKSLVTLFILFAGASCFAQSALVSNAIKLNSKTPNFKVLGRAGNNYVVNRYGATTHVLDIYNSSLKLLQSKEIKLPKDQFIERYWLQPKDAWIISLRHGKDKSYLEAHKLDTKFNIAQRALVLDSIVERKDLIESNLRTTLSLNESKLLIFSPIFSQGKIDYFYTKVYDNQMNVLSQLKIRDTNLTDKSFEDVMLLNDGSFLFVTKDKDAGDDNEIYYLSYVRSDGSISHSSFIPIMQVFKKLAFEIDNTNQKLIITGFFKEPALSRNQKTGASSFFVSKFDLPSFENVFTEIVPITNEFYLNLTGKPSDLNTPQVYTFYVNSVLPRLDGGMIILTESYFKTEDVSSNPSFFPGSSLSNMNYTTNYNFNDIVVYHIDSTGQCTAQEIIRKKQVSSDDAGSYSSFAIANLQDEIRILFLDEIDVNAHFSQANLKEESLTKAKTIFNLGSKNVFPVVKMSKQVSPSEILVPSYFRNKLQLIKLRF